MADVALRAYQLGLVSGGLGLLFSIISIATPEWTVSDGTTIGLWTLTDENGQSFSWTEQWKYSGDFYYSDWMQACRGMMMSGVMIAGFAVLYNFYVLCRNQYSVISGKILLFYYFLASFLLLITACVYSSEVPQPVYEADKIVDYIYRGGYGYSLWLCWISGGLFMPAAAVTHEGAYQSNLAKQRKILQEANVIANDRATNNYVSPM